MEIGAPILVCGLTKKEWKVREDEMDKESAEMSGAEGEKNEWTKKRG